MRIAVLHLCRFIGVLLFAAMYAGAVSAYTIIYHGGKRAEIPNNFVVTKNAVIYETSPGFNISIQLSAIDIPATERANNETAGGFLRRIGRENSQPVVQAQTASRTITNRDLEPYQRARIENERASEKRREELGLPSLEETRREAERRDARLDQFIEQRQREQSEQFWREREFQMQMMMRPPFNPAEFNGAQPFWSGGVVPFDGVFDSRSGFNRHGVLRQGSPCGFNASVPCLLTHPFGFNEPRVPRNRLLFATPGRINNGRRGGGVFISPGGRRH